ncbi:MAG: hypothetical protein ABI222_02375, partial [Opitutaceae bacterium]
YLGGIVVVGIRSRGRQDNINDYFTAHGSFRGRLGRMLVGLSIAATLFSGLSFIVYPSLFYSYGLTVLSGLAGFPLSYIFMRWWFLPRYLAMDWSSPYEIIERRFGRRARLLASAFFILSRLSWMAALIYAPVIVVVTALNIGNEWLWPVVALIGLSSTAYTVVGGIRGVIITDAIQLLLIAAALLGTIIFIVVKIPLSLGEVVTFVRTNTPLLHLNWSLDPRVTITVAALGIGGSIGNLGSYSADQMALQRYLAAGDARAATSAFGTSVIAMPFVLVLLAAVGLAIGAWYSVHPDAALPTQADKVFPYFVATQLPVGFIGIVIAAILAATMSSITSGINALSGSLLNDFIPLATRVGPKQLLGYARWVSAGIGVLATLGAGYVEKIGSLFEIMTVLLGIFSGPLLGCMLCAVSRFRIKGSVMIGAMGAGFLTSIGIVSSPVSPIWVTLGSTVITLLTAGLVSLIIPGQSGPDGRRNAQAKP